MSPSRYSEKEAMQEILSDESSFYGDDDEKEKLENAVKSYDPELYWSNYHAGLLSTKQNKLRPPAPRATTGDDDEPMADAEASAPGSLPPNRRGQKEPIAHFLARLPPSTTNQETAGPWIWMHRYPQTIEPGDEPTFTRRGVELLHAYEDTSAELRAAHDKSGAKTTAPLTRKLNPLRQKLEKDIFALARETRVLAGKWMLFPSPRDVDGVWKTVVEAMEQGKLSRMAKVATDDGSDKARLICVYTPDFGDAEDVKRVVRSMAELGLVKGKEKPIYYKCDAYTLLDITSKNEYGLKASMYSSRDMLER